jgi:hypothetical protein
MSLIYKIVIAIHVSRKELALPALPGSNAASNRSVLAETPWNHKFSGNFCAKSGATITYRQNRHFKELSGSAEMDRLEPVVWGKNVLSQVHSGNDGEVSRKILGAKKRK